MRKRASYSILLVNWKCALSTVVVDLRVFLEPQVSGCESGALDCLNIRYVLVVIFRKIGDTIKLYFEHTLFSLRMPWSS